MTVLVLIHRLSFQGWRDQIRIVKRQGMLTFSVCMELKKTTTLIMCGWVYRMVVTEHGECVDRQGIEFLQRGASLWP